MGDVLRSQVIKVFRQLHKTRKHIFRGDEHALEVARRKINEEYRKNQHVTDEVAIIELNRFAKECEHELRTTVVRAVEKKPGVYELELTPDTVMVDNSTINKNISELKKGTKKPS